MIRSEESARRKVAYQTCKKMLSRKPYYTKTRQIFKDVADVLGYETRSISNIYYEERKKEEKQLRKIRVSKREGARIVESFTDYINDMFFVRLSSNSDNNKEDTFTIDLEGENEYSFDFFIEVNYEIFRAGDGILEPIEKEAVIKSYNLSLTGIFNKDGYEIILQQKYIQEIEDHLFDKLKLNINYYG